MQVRADITWKGPCVFMNAGSLLMEEETNNALFLNLMLGQSQVAKNVLDSTRQDN